MHNTDETLNQDAFLTTDALSDSLDLLEAQYSLRIQEQRLLIDQLRRKAAAAQVHESSDPQRRQNLGPDFVLNPRRAA